MNTYTSARCDLNGNTLSGGGRTNTWDSQNRLVQCVNGATTSAFTYGADGLRRSMTINGGTPILFALDGQNAVQEGHSAAGQFVADVTYLTGPRGPEYRKDENTGELRWYLYDGLGSVVAEVGEPDGNDNPVKATREYDVYGAVRGSTGSSDSQHQFVGSLGHATEPDTGGLIYMRARWMDPFTGRFVSEDPKRDGENWYLYCYPNPVNAVDPTGEATLGDVLTSSELAEGLEGFAGGVAQGAAKRMAARIVNVLWDWTTTYGLALGEDASLVFGTGTMTITAAYTEFGHGYGIRRWALRMPILRRGMRHERRHQRHGAKGDVYARQHQLFRHRAIPPAAGTP